VQAFLERRLAFTSIPRVIEHVLEHCAIHEANTLQAILDDDALARDLAIRSITSGIGMIAS